MFPLALKSVDESKVFASEFRFDSDHQESEWFSRDQTPRVSTMIALLGGFAALNSLWSTNKTITSDVASASSKRTSVNSQS